MSGLSETISSDGQQNNALMSFIQDNLSNYSKQVVAIDEHKKKTSEERVVEYEAELKEAETHLEREREDRGRLHLFSKMYTQMNRGISELKSLRNNDGEYLSSLEYHHKTLRRMDDRTYDYLSNVHMDCADLLGKDRSGSSFDDEQFTFILEEYRNKMDGISKIMEQQKQDSDEAGLKDIMRQLNLNYYNDFRTIEELQSSGETGYAPNPTIMSFSVDSDYLKAILNSQIRVFYLKIKMMYVRLKLLLERSYLSFVVPVVARVGASSNASSNASTQISQVSSLRIEQLLSALKERWNLEKWGDLNESIKKINLPYFPNILNIFGKELGGQSGLNAPTGDVLRDNVEENGNMKTGIKDNIMNGLGKFASGVLELPAKTKEAVLAGVRAVGRGASATAAAVTRRAEQAPQCAQTLLGNILLTMADEEILLLAGLIFTYLLSLPAPVSPPPSESYSRRSWLPSKSSSLGGSKKSRKRINRALLRRNKSKLSLKKANKGMSKRNKGKLSLKRSNKGMSKRNKNKKRTNKRVLTHKKKKHIGGLYIWDEKGDNRPKGFVVLGPSSEFTNNSSKNYLMKTARKILFTSNGEYKKNFKLGTLEVVLGSEKKKISNC